MKTTASDSRTKTPKRFSKCFSVFTERGENEGTGIGLAMCRKIAAQHGGAIQAQSLLGEGSTFIVELPVKQQEKIAQ